MTLKNVLFTGISAIALAACSTSGAKNGTCCEKAYMDPEDALSCFSHTNDGNHNSSDERMLLIAFVEKDLKAHQKLSWNLIKDEDIRKLAKLSYALVILDTSRYGILNDSCTSLTGAIISQQKSDIVFVLANQAKCPFSYWTLQDDKETILDRLSVGNGP